jgi:DNA modification methylase
VSAVPVVLRGDAAHLPLPDGSVDLIVTSPPYFGLRSYTDGGEHYGGQIGSEATPAAYVAALLECTREWVRVLKPSGSVFVNLGDKYSGAQQQNSGRQSATTSAEYWRRTDPKRTGIPNKSLMGLPWRYALACIDELGLILRAEVIWAKPNGLPESVTDRVRRSHEQVFHFTRLPRYYAAVDEIREPHMWPGKSPGGADSTRASGPQARNGHSQWERTRAEREATSHNPLGKLPGSVWEIASQPLTVPPELGVDHFAAFPFELPRRIISGWSPPGVCTVCGEGRRPVTEYTPGYAEHRGAGTDWNRNLRAANGYDGTGDRRTGTRPLSASRLITAWTCSCDSDGFRSASGMTLPATRPGVVLDPFGGTGTTALVASVLGRTGITVDRSADYCRLARWRTSDPGERARAMQVPKPAPQLDGQGSLFDDEEAS